MIERNKYDNVQTQLDRHSRAWSLAEAQADISGLWFPTDNIEVAFLQQELRRLHAVIEGDDKKYYSKDDLV